MDLYEYQRYGVDWMVCRERGNPQMFGDKTLKLKGGILADEVGLGKTMMSTSVVKENPKMNTLVLVPKSLMVQWRDEILKCWKGASVELCEHDGSFTKNTDPNVSHIVIAPHSRLNGRCATSCVQNPLCKMYWDRIIIDEAHVIKNKRTKMHKVCCELKTDVRWALTATPVMNRMDDFVNTLRWIGVPQDVCQNYKTQVTKEFVLRRTKVDVTTPNKELPPCNVEIVSLPFGSEQEQALYDGVYEDARDSLMSMKRSNNKNTVEALELLLRVRQVCCHPQCYVDGVAKKHKMEVEKWDYGCTKVNNICSDISNTPAGDKCLVFCHFISEMDAYCKTLASMGIQCARLDGKMTTDQRLLNVETFKQTPSYKALVVQVNTGGVGYNFQVANWVYITSPMWNPSLQHQVVGRAHRNGQTKAVHVKVYRISDSEKGSYIEDYILALQERKRALIAEILEDPRISNGKTVAEVTASTITFADVVKMFRHKPS